MLLVLAGTGLRGHHIAGRCGARGPSVGCLAWTPGPLSPFVFAHPASM